MLFGRTVNRYYLRYGLILLLGVLALVCVDFLQLKIPELYRNVINGINTGVIVTPEGEIPFDMDYLLSKICLPLMFIILAMVAGRFLWRVCFFGSAISVERDLRDRMFHHCLGLSHEYYQTNKVGSLMSLFTNDLETVQSCFGDGVLMLFDAVILGGLALYKMFRLDHTLTLFALVPMALLLCMATFVGRVIHNRWEKRQEAYSALSDFAHETFSGIAVIKAFVKETKQLITFKKCNKAHEDASLSHTRAATLMRVLVTLFVESVICVILGYGGFLVYKGTFDAGRLVEYIGYFNATIWPIMAVSELIEMSARGKASLGRISELLDAKFDVADSDTVQKAEITSGAISVKHLTFCYPGGSRNVLRDVSFDILPGEHVGLVGKTGSGKTTLVDLLLRVYNVPDGTVYFDGKDVNTLPIRTVRDAIAYVPQDQFLFSDTIAANIAFARSDATETEICTAATAAALHDNIADFPQGYQTVLGERGVTVSGGQKQRIALARALLKRAKVRVLDDSVSAVDTATEETILANLRRDSDCTTILIAHRISTITAMDKIVFLENGAVAAVGTHQELYATCPAYQKMVDLQKLKEEGGEPA